MNNIKEFKLHSKGENWFHFRKDPDSIMESFSITYFAEKVVRAEDQKIKTWKKDLAVKEIEEYLKNAEDEILSLSDDQITCLKNVLDKLSYFEDGEYGYIQMVEAFQDNSGDDSGIDSETYLEFGRCYTDAFKGKYEKLISVSEIILKEVGRI